MFINILIYVTNENIAYIKTMLYSMLINKKPQTRYRIFCLEYESEKATNSLSFLFQNEKNFCIRHIEIEKLIADLKLDDEKDFNKCFKLCLNKIINEINIKIGLKKHNENIKKRVNEESVDKIIYLNHDLIINSDLTELYNINLLDDDYLGTVFYTSYNKIFGNMILFNVKRIIAESVFDKLLIKLDNDGHNLNTIENQDELLYTYLGKHIKPLSIKFNLPNIDLSKHIYQTNDIDDLKELLRDINNPLIFNYVNIPWCDSYVIYSDIWKQYYKQVLYYELQMSR